MQDIGRGTHKLVAARYTFRRLFLAGLTALLADAVGFAVLMVIDIPVIQELAHDRQPRRRRAHLHQAAAAAGAAVVHRREPAAAERSLRAEQRRNGAARASARCGTGSTASPTRRWALGAVAVSLVLGGVGLAVSQQLRIGDLDPGAPELRAGFALQPRQRLHHRELRAVQRPVRHDRQDRQGRLPQVRDAGRGRPPRVGAAAGARRADTVSLADAVRQITAGSYEGNPKWFTLTRNQDVLNYGAQQARSATRAVQHRVLGDAGDRVPRRPQGRDAGPRRRGSARQFARQHDGPDRASCSQPAAPASRRRTNIVVREANRDDAAVRLCSGDRACASSPSAAGARSWSRSCRSRITSILCEALMVALGIGVKVATLPVIALGVGHRRRLRALPAVGAARAAARGPAARRDAYKQAVQFTGKVVALVGRHARRRRGHLGIFADQVPGRHGHSADLHVPVEHARRADPDPGAVALPASDLSGPRDTRASTMRHQG